jgi:hypothetical protein
MTSKYIEADCRKCDAPIVIPVYDWEPSGNNFCQPCAMSYVGAVPDDYEPTDKQMNPHYYSDTSSFTEGGVTYGGRTN